VASYQVPTQEARAETRVSNSRFIASAAPTFSVDQAKAFIARIRSELSDATHHVSAYIIGFGASTIAHCHDDGEPSGTAGRPALAVLSGSGFGDVVVVVTRYFGGTKLGTGGLVRAYSDAVRAVLAILPRAERVTTQTVMITLPYARLERLRLLVHTYHGQVLDEEFTTEVTLTARFAEHSLPAFQAALQQASNGQLQAIVIETSESIVPTGSF
jgi:uncharacterized YigZ family protein